MAMAMAASAQIAEVSAPQPLLRGVESEMYNPVLSADGSRLLFSHSDFSDLREYDFNNEVTRKVSADRRQAFAAHFEGNTVVFDNPTLRCEGASVVLSANGKETVISPVDCEAGYLWASLSPDGKKVMFLAAGKGIYITDLKGNVLATPGNFEYPVWYGNDNIVVQNATDDGHQYHSSQIVMLSLDGKVRQDLTRPESMSMAPTASAAAGRIVYSTIDGRLYQMNVTLKK